MKKLLLRQLGFNLIELMIVVAIIAILAAIAIPSYTHYTNKARFTEIIQAVAPFRLAVEACAYQYGDLTHCSNDGQGNSHQGIPPALHNMETQQGYVKSVVVHGSGANAVQIVAISQNIGGKDQSYSYLLDGILQTNGQLRWSKDTQSTCNAAGLC